MRDYYGYRKKAQKQTFRNRVIALIMAAVLVITGWIIAKNKDKDNESANMGPQINNEQPMDPNLNVTGIENNYGGPVIIEDMGATGIHADVDWNFEQVEEVAPTPIPTPMATPIPQNGGDTVIAKTDVNIRFGADVNSFKIGTLKEGSIVNRIYTDGEWDLVYVDGIIAFVNTRYTRTYEMDYNNEYYDVDVCRDIVRTTSKLYLRNGPSQNESSIDLLDKKEQLVVIGRTTDRNNPNDTWLIVKARGTIGFVCEKYTQSIRSELLALDPTLSEVAFEQIARVTKDTVLMDQYGNSIANIDKHQLVNIVEQYGNSSLVEIDGKVGFISSKALNVVKGALLAVDLSTQRVFYYVNGEIAFMDRCTTGKKSSPTEIGYFTPYGKTNTHDFGHDGYKAKILWMPFNGGQGLHDADWEDDENFGKPVWTASNGSAGCVRLRKKGATFIYENVSKSTPALVKK